MENTAKNFALQLGSLLSLYVSIGALIGLLFGIITVLYPDPAQYAWEYEGAASTIRSTIAILIVFFPTYVMLTRFVNNIRRTEQGTYLTLTRWLIYISLLIGGGVLLGDLVATLMGFLNGELTIRFVLKALSVLIVVGAAFAYYLADVRGYWQTHEQHSIIYAGVTAVVVLAVIVIGFMRIETPTEVREMNIDNQQVSDLQNIQAHIEAYVQINGTLPNDLDEVFEGISAPAASEGRSAYRYERINAQSFRLCAEFSKESSLNERMMYPDYSYAKEMRITPTSWEHGAGQWCYERVVNPLTPEIRP